jgi:hypothetical protein
VTSIFLGEDQSAPRRAPLITVAKDLLGDYLRLVRWGAACLCRPCRQRPASPAAGWALSQGMAGDWCRRQHSSAGRRRRYRPAGRLPPLTCAGPGLMGLPAARPWSMR